MLQRELDLTSEPKAFGETDKTPTVTNPQLYQQQQWSAAKFDVRQTRKRKKRMYNHRVMSIEQGTFTPECKVFLKSLFRKIAVKLWFLVLKFDLKSPPPLNFLRWAWPQLSKKGVQKPGAGLAQIFKLFVFHSVPITVHICYNSYIVYC